VARFFPRNVGQLRHLADHGCGRIGPGIVAIGTGSVTKAYTVNAWMSDTYARWWLPVLGSTNLDKRCQLSLGNMK